MNEKTSQLKNWLNSDYFIPTGLVVLAIVVGVIFCSGLLALVLINSFTHDYLAWFWAIMSLGLVGFLFYGGYLYVLVLLDKIGAIAMICYAMLLVWLICYLQDFVFTSFIPTVLVVLGF